MNPEHETLNTKPRTPNPEPRAARVAAIILAGGAGKRMGSADTHKVCFPILGRPAICRAIETYKQAGLNHFIVVVGQKAEQVMATVAREHPDVSFVFQTEPNGTGHAASIAVDALSSQGFSGRVLITMGDKVVHPGVIAGLLSVQVENGPALAMATLPFAAGTGAGRVLLDGDGDILGILEKADLEKARSLGQPLLMGDRSLSIAQVEEMEARSNGSLYLFRFDALREAIGKLRPDNEQGELYLTDTVGLLRAAGEQVVNLPVSEKERLMAFNTPAELLAIEEVLRACEKPSRVRLAEDRRLNDSQLKPASEWLELLGDESSSAFNATLADIFGQNPGVIAEQRRQMIAVVECFAGIYGADRKIVICRAPGRINLMGRHIEHRGGDINVMAISRETIVAASPREDDSVCLHNLDSRFTDRSFRISELLEETSWEDWIDFIDSHTVRDILRSAPGDWSHYARAPLLRLQHEASDRPLRGMDCVVGGNIPMGAGLSSSSALVVAFAETAIAFNDLEIETADLIDICGEGEWFVGSRGGNGDHAAIRTSRIGSISRIGFFPFELKKQVMLPEGLRLVIADSGIQAKKSAGAKDAFNHRIASYQIGQMLLQKTWPAAAGIKHLRDLCPNRLKVEPADIYRALKELPENPTRSDIRALFNEEDQPALDRIFSSHADIGPYDLRGVVLYGLAECTRAESFGQYLESGDLAKIGELMGTSHDGDRVARSIDQRSEDRYQKSDVNSSEAETPNTEHKTRNPKPCPAPSNQPASSNEEPITSDPTHFHSHFNFPTTNQGLDDYARKNTGLASLPGAYACSTPEIDALVDLASSVEGVIGAQLSGAGLGGCVMILVRAGAEQDLRRTLTDRYFAPLGLPANIHTCQPVHGAGLLAAPAAVPAA